MNSFERSWGLSKKYQCASTTCIEKSLLVSLSEAITSSDVITSSTDITWFWFETWRPWNDFIDFFQIKFVNICSIVNDWKLTIVRNNSSSIRCDIWIYHVMIFSILNRPLFDEIFKFFKNLHPFRYSEIDPNFWKINSV